MKNKNKLDAVNNELKQIARNWPKPNGEFVYFLEDDHLWLHKIRLPENTRGGEGTKRLAKILSITDKANLLVCLTADPVFDDNGTVSTDNPDTFQLVRWYMRFGFIPHGPTEDGFSMERPSKSGSSEQSVLFEYNYNKRNNDLTMEQFRSRWTLPQFKND